MSENIEIYLTCVKVSLGSVDSSLFNCDFRGRMKPHKRVGGSFFYIQEINFF